MTNPENTRFPPGLWLIFVYLTIDFLAGTSKPLESWLYQVLAFPRTGWSAESPLYFVRADVVDGYLATIVLAITAVIVVAGWRRYRVAVVIVGLIAVLQCVPDMIVGLDIIVRCDSLASETAATCPWTTADAYIWNGLHIAYRFLVLGVVLAMAFIFRRSLLAVKTPTGSGRA